jgi:hypothetical protein
VSNDTDDPVIKAIIALVDDCCAVAVGEATGFYNGRTAEELKREARAKFIVEMNKATQDEGP